MVDPEELTLSRNEASLEELAKSRMKKRSVEILEKTPATENVFFCFVCFFDVFCWDEMCYSLFLL